MILTTEIKLLISSNEFDFCEQSIPDIPLDLLFFWTPACNDATMRISPILVSFAVAGNGNLHDLR